MLSSRLDPPACKIPEGLSSNQYENIDHECHLCGEYLNVHDDNWELALDSELSKEVMYHTKCLGYLSEKENRNTDEPNIFVEHKL